MNNNLIAVVAKGVDGVSGRLASGVDIDQRDHDGRTLLMHAALDGRIEVVTFLVGKNANVNIVDRAGFTALHFAAQEQFSDIAELLLAAGAKIDARDSFGNTPLWRAVFTSKGKDRTTRLLVAHGANRSEMNESGVSPESLANAIKSHDLTRVFG